jgi:hypothetical protein
MHRLCGYDANKAAPVAKSKRDVKQASLVGFAKSVETRFGVAVFHILD